MTPKPLAALVVALALAASCTSDRETPAPTTTTEAAAAPVCDPAFDAWEEAGFTGSVTILRGDTVECDAGYGVAAETVFSIGSITKAVTAASVYRLVDDGVLALDDRAGDHVAGLGGPAAEATVEQLLLHTSGLTGSHGADHEPLDRDQAVANLSRLELAFEPGTDFLYSNAGYTLLALVVEEASGVPHRELTPEVLTLPDGHVAGGFWDGEPAAPGPRAEGVLDDGSPGEDGSFGGPHWALDGNGSLAMTTSDLAAWTRALFTGDIVSPASAEAIATPGFDNGDGSAETPGWVRLDDPSFGEPLLTASGGGGDVGHHAVAVWLPESDRTVAVASSSPELTAGELVQAIGPALVAGDPLPTPERPAPVDPDALAAAEGTYRLASGGTLAVTATDEGLSVAAEGPDAAAALFPLDPDGDVAPEDAEAHEALVLDLLAGATPDGRAERSALEEALGPITELVPAGTVVDGGELRTYVTVVAERGTELVWFAVDDEGGVAAAEVPASSPPTLALVPAEGGGFRPDDPAGRGPDVALAFADGTVTVTGPDGSLTAER